VRDFRPALADAASTELRWINLVCNPSAGIPTTIACWITPGQMQLNANVYGRDSSGATESTNHAAFARICGRVPLIPTIPRYRRVLIPRPPRSTILVIRYSSRATPRKVDCVTRVPRKCLIAEPARNRIASIPALL